MTRWSSAGRGNALWDYQEQVPVSLIATPRHDFVTCRVDESVADVPERNRAALFDHIPVVATTPKGEEIVGVFDAVDWFEKTSPAGDVKGNHRLLSEDVLIGADASVLDFIRDADERPFRFVVSDLGISGLVSLSDLQQIAARAALFAMVTHLETVMAAAIRARWSADKWLARLEPEQRRSVEATIRRGQRENTLVDPVLYTSLSAKIAVLRDAIPADLGGPSQFWAELGDLPSFRNSVAHASEYAETRARARWVCGLVRAMDRWIRGLDEWSRAAVKPDRSRPVGAPVVEVASEPAVSSSGTPQGRGELPRVLCIGVDVTWWGGGDKAPESQFETIVSASLLEPEALKIERIDLGGSRNPRGSHSTEPNFDADGALLAHAILEVVDRHPAVDRVIVALDAPLECCERPGQKPRRKSVAKGVRMGSIERQAERALREFMRSAPRNGWNRDLRIQAGSPIPPRIAKIVEHLRFARPDLLPTYSQPDAEPRGVVEVFPSEAIWALGVLGSYGDLDSLSVRSYKSKNPRVLDADEAAEVARRPLVGFRPVLLRAGVPPGLLDRWSDRIADEALRVARHTPSGGVLKRKCFDDPIDSGIAFLTAAAAAIGGYHTWGDGSDGLILGPGRLPALEGTRRLSD